MKVYGDRRDKTPRIPNALPFYENNCATSNSSNKKNSSVPIALRPLWSSGQSFSLQIQRSRSSNLPGGNGRPALKADNLTAVCESTVYKMWEPRRLTTLWVSTACYKERFIFFYPKNNYSYSILNHQWNIKAVHTTKRARKILVRVQNLRRIHILGAELGFPASQV
jgi:hypothetical protein